MTKDNHLEDHEAEEARSWGRRLGVAAGERLADDAAPEMHEAARQESEYPADESDEG